MASSGWLGEKYVHGWGNYGSRFVANVYINSITRNRTNIRVKGTVKFSSYANTSYSYYYYAINAFVNNVGIGQIKPYTGANNIRNKAWSRNFDVTVNCSQSATSVNLPVRFNDPTTGWVHETVTYTLYFNTYSKGPSGIKSSASYTQYSTITTSCSSINWGQGYSSRKLTCTASYTYNGKTENFTLGTWTDGATSKSVTKSNFNFPADLNVSIKWVASTNIGSTTATTQVKVGQTYPAPNLSNVTFSGNSNGVYKFTASASNIDYGKNYSKREATLYLDYKLDGVSYSTQLKKITNGATSISISYNASSLAEPWTKIPDDENATLRLVVDNGHQTATKKSGSYYCQSQYEAYIIELVNNETVVTPATLSANGKNGSGQFKQIRRIGIK